MGRVFTPDERRIIRDGPDPDRVLWSLWAGKETGYKAVSRLYPAVSSAPRRYEVHLPSTGGSVPEWGSVCTPCGPVVIRLCITDDYVHCIGATTEGGGAIAWDVREVSEARSDGSAFVRRMAKRGVSAWLGEMPEAVEIIRPEGDHGLAPPVVKVRGERSAICLSMSHDGRFAAWAFSTYPAQLTSP